MKVEWKVDLTPILVALILAVAAVTVAGIMKPNRYVPVGVGAVGTEVGYRLDTESGNVMFGP
jgi:hypothetical protein